MATKSKKPANWELGRETKFFNGTLRKVRLERGYKSIEDAARMIGCSKVSLQHYESMRSVPSPQMAEKIAKFYKKKPEELFPREFLKVVAEDRSYRKKVDFAEMSVRELNAATDYADKQTRLLEETTSPVNTFEKREAKKAFYEALSDANLSERQLKIISMHFGLNGYAPRTIEEVACEFDVTRERIKQIEKKALNWLRYKAKGDENFKFARDVLLGCEPDAKKKVRVVKKEPVRPLENLVGRNV